MKIGDKVKVIGNSYPKHHFAIGDVVEVTGLPDDGGYSGIELCGHCDWQEPGDTWTQYLSMCDIEEINSTQPFTIGQTYKTAEMGDVTCITLRDDGGMFAVFGDDDAAYSWNADGSYRCVLPHRANQYQIVFEPVVTDHEVYVETPHGDILIKYTITDGKPDWASAKVTQC